MVPSRRSGAAAGAARLPFALARKCIFYSVTAAVLGAAFAGCLDRDVVGNPVRTTAEVTIENRQSIVSKIDLLFMIDDSRSMADKQAYLKAAIPDLVKRFVTPNCVDEDDPNKSYGPSNEDGTCARGKVEFKPVKDIHIGIVSSSLGGLGSEGCSNDVGTTENKGGRLILPAATEPYAPSGFLAWAPAGGGGPGAVTTTKDLQNDFQDMVAGVGQTGCGFEAQLESWYRFLVSPDPYGSVTIDGNGNATLVDWDKTILKQRHDFLRPDSLVAIIDLSDENDSAVDPLALGGRGWEFMQPIPHLGDDKQPHGWSPARATVACDTNPASPDCTSCDLPHPADDANCKLGRYSADDTDPVTRDNANLRHVHMKQRYGVDPQFPLSRYVLGLTSPKVPDRDHEHQGLEYVATPNCTNPLFASALPDGSSTNHDTLCNLPVGRRTKDLIFFAHIGGVPSELLHFDANDPAKRALTEDDWTKIIGKDPDKFDLTGIDPHMIESTKPRNGIPGATDAPSDPIIGRDYLSTAPAVGSDLMYACRFPLTDLTTDPPTPAPKNCLEDKFKDTCDCPTSPPDAHWIAGWVPPVCDPAKPTTQVYARAYPTIRELHLAKLLGTQGVISSICPTHVTPIGGSDDPQFGYRPAVISILDRLKSALQSVCVPHELKKDPALDNRVPCLVLETLPTPGPESACDAIPGRSQPKPEILNPLREQQRLAAEKGDTDLRPFPVCQVDQLGASDGTAKGCRDSKKPGWCYVENTSAGACSQALQFSDPGNPQSGASVSMACLESL